MGRCGQGRVEGGVEVVEGVGGQGVVEGVAVADPCERIGRRL